MLEVLVIDIDGAATEGKQTSGMYSKFNAENDEESCIWRDCDYTTIQ